MLRTPTRAQYLDGTVTHAEYYRALAHTAGIKVPDDHWIVAKARHALASGDEHLNTIALSAWDRWAVRLLPSIRTAFKAHGDGDSPAGRVCILKQAVRDAVDRDKSEEEK